MRRTVSAFLIVVLGAPALTGTDARPPLFQADVEMVRLNVSVLNPRDRFVEGLGADDFVVLENGVKQKVMLFDPKDLPLSLVLLLDMSASMAPHRKAVVRAASRLIDRLRPQDEAEIVSFSQRLTVLEKRTTDHAALLAALERTQPEGTTALHNALYVTLKDLQRADGDDSLRRRAVVLLSDGEDTSSAVTDDQVLELARTAQIGLYTILMSAVPRSAPSAARHLLDALAHESGGEAFFLDGVSELHGVYERIAQELHSQYCLGYVSSHTEIDGRWRQILVLTPQRETRVRHRVGYYAGRRPRPAVIPPPAVTAP